MLSQNLYTLPKYSCCGNLHNTYIFTDVVTMYVQYVDNADLCSKSLWNTNSGQMDESFVFGLTGDDKYTTFYRLFQEKDATVLKEITTECHWVGAKSLYRTMVVSERMSTVEAMKASAVESISSKKGPLKSLKKRNAEQQEQRNQKRRPQQKDKCIDMCSSLAMVSEQLQSLATFLLSRLVDFDVQKCPDIMNNYNECLDSLPLAKEEIRKLGYAEPPGDVASAGQLMAQVLSLKSAVDMRSVARSGHSQTFDGSRWMKRKGSMMSRSSDSKGTPASSPRAKSARTAETPRPSPSASSSGCGSQDCEGCIHTYIYIHFLFELFDMIWWQQINVVWEIAGTP